MRYLSLFSGIEAASVAWKPLGWECVGVAEIDPFPCAVLKHHYPDVPNLGSVTEITDEQLRSLGRIDVVVGGSPCQDLSVAGKRAGLAGERSGLFHEQLRIFHAARHFCGARFLVWENVPGAFSTNQGRDFARVVGEMAGLSISVPEDGWGTEGVALGSHGLVEWCVLDAQWFGVAQRRRRVFAVLDAGNWADRQPILLEPDCERGDFAPRRAPGKGAAPCVTSGAPFSRTGNDRVESDAMIVESTPKWLDGAENGCWPAEAAPTLTASYADKQGLENQHALNGAGLFVHAPIPFDTTQVTSKTNRSNPQAGDPCHTLSSGAHPPSIIEPIAFHPTQTPISSTDGTTHRMGTGSSLGGATVAVAVVSESGDVASTLRTGGNDHADIYNSVAVAFEAATEGGNSHADAAKAGPVEALRALRDAVGAEAFTVWGLGVLASLQSPEVLRSAVHGLGLRLPAFSRSWVVDRALSREKGGSAWLLQSLRETGCEGCPPQGWEPSEQLAGELGAYLSELSQPGAQAERFLRGLWSAAEGSGVLRQALSAIQEVGRSAGREGQPAPSGVAMQVRRLTATECEFLQGFPRGYTAIPWRGKAASECPDGPRYKALGNSMAVPVMAWIGKRIQEVTHGLA